MRLLWSQGRSQVQTHRSRSLGIRGTGQSNSSFGSGSSGRPASPASKPSRPAPARLVPPPQPEVIIIRVTANIDGRLNGMVPTYCRKLIEDALRKMPGVHNLAVEVV